MIKSHDCEGFEGATTGEWNRVGPNETSSMVTKKKNNASLDSKNRRYRFQF
jgi:hypothetical protein